MVTLVFGPEFGSEQMRLVSYSASYGLYFADAPQKTVIRRDRGGELSLHSPANVITKRERCRTSRQPTNTNWPGKGFPRPNTRPRNVPKLESRENDLRVVHGHLPLRLRRVVAEQSVTALASAAPRHPRARSIRARRRMGRVPGRGDEPLRDAYCGRSSFAPRGAGRHAVVVLLSARRLHGRRAAAEGSKRGDRAATDVPARRVRRRGAQPLNHNTYILRAASS